MSKSFTFAISLLGALIALADIQQTNADDPWVLPGFKQIKTTRLSKNGRKCWMKSTYHVCLTRNDDRTKLYWRNGENQESEALVRMDVDKYGNISQDWKYKDAVIAMTLSEDGASTQTWTFGDDKFEVNRDSDGTSEAKWEGTEQPEKVENFKNFINSWCEHNDFFVGKDNCAIYAKTRENEPEWILPGFDKTQVNKLNRAGKRCWADRKYHVCLKKTRGDTNLYWKKEITETKVLIDLSSEGNNLQKWTYQGNRVEINRYADGTVVQIWNFGSSKFLVNIDPDDEAIDKKWKGKENPEALKKFQQFIDAWCENNDFFVGKQNCKIYEV